MAPGTSPFCRQVDSYQGLVQAVADRSEQMEISRSELDRLANLADGHTAKIIGARPAKKFGILSLGAILQTLGLIMVIVEDPVARDQTLAKRTPFSAGNRRMGNTSYLGSRPQIESPEPAKIALKPRPEPASRAHLRVVQQRAGLASRPQRF